MVAPTTDERTTLERMLRVVTEVRSGEGVLSLTLALNIFLLLTAYYIIKPVREALIIPLKSGPEFKIYLSAVIALVLVFAVPMYARFVDRLPRLRLVVGVTLFFASHLVLFYLASGFELLERYMPVVFFVWIGVFNMMVVAQLWSFANDLFTEEQGTRLFALVALGATLGATLGSGVAGWLVVPLGRYKLLLVGAATLVACALLFVVSERLSVEFRTRHSQEPALMAAAKARDAKREPPRGAFALVFRHRYLLAIALFTLVFSWANTNGEYMLSRLVKASASEAVQRGELAPNADAVGDFIGAVYADFYLAVNALAVFVQVLVVSRIAKYGSTGPALFILPFISLANGLAVLAVPTLAVLRVGKTLENATDYSLNNTVRQMLWLPTTYEMKFKAKQAVDTFFVRIGDVSSALLVLVGTELLSWSVRGFAAANAALAAAWIFFAWRIRREGARLSPPPAAPNTPAAATGAASG